MNPNDLLAYTKHRPYELSKGAWQFYQEWNKAIFLHWELDPNLVEPMVPKGLSLDVLNGKTWISLVAFDMNNIGVRGLPKLPHVSDFYEVNIRTYVVHKGKPGVYFLNIEGSKRASCRILKSLSKLPYQHSIMKRSSSSFDSKSNVLKNMLSVEFRLKEKFTKDKTDLWLTERYTLFQNYESAILAYDVHHVEWPMQRIELETLNLDYPEFNHLINKNPDRIHYSKGVEVLTWNKKKYKL